MEFPLLTLPVLAAKLGVVESRIRRLCADGSIPYGLVGDRRVFRVDDIDQIRAVCVERGMLTRSEPAQLDVQSVR